MDTELRKISDFYALQEQQLLQELSELEELIKEQDEIGMLAGRLYSDSQWDEDDDEDEDEDHWESTERSQEHSTSKRRRRASTSVGRAMSQGGG